MTEEQGHISITNEQINRAILVARAAYPTEFQQLVKNIEIGADGVWIPDNEQFRKVFDEWYIECKEKLGNDFITFVEGDAIPEETSEGQTQSSLPDKETLAALRREAEELTEVTEARRVLIEKRTRLYVEDLKRRARRPLTPQELDAVESGARRAFSEGRRPAGNEFLDPLQKTASEKVGDDLATGATKDTKAANLTVRESITRQHGGARPDTLFSIYRNSLEKDDHSSIKQSSRNARLADGFSAEEDENDPVSLFRALAEHEGSTIQEKATGRILDSFTNTLRPEERKAVTNNVLTRAIRDIAENSQPLSDRVGSETAAIISKNLKTQLADTTSAQPLSGAAKILSDVGYSVFGRQAQEDVATILAIENNAAATIRSGGGSVLKHSFVAGGAGTTETTVLVNGVFVSGKINTTLMETAVVHSRLPFEFSLFSQQGGKLIVSAAGKVGVSAAGGAAGKAAVATAGKKAAGGVIAKFLAGLGIKAGAGAAAGAAGGGAIGNVPGAIIGFIVGSLIEPIFKGIKSGANKLFSGKLIPFVGKSIDAVSSYFGNGPPPPQKDSAGLVIIIIIALAITLPLGTTLFQTTSYRGSALVAPIGSGPGGPIISGAPPGPKVVWFYSGDPPVGTINTCPVSGGTITQRPYESFSHANSKAYDLAFYQGSPIFAAHDAYVVSYRDNLDPYTFENRSYGNYVLLVAKTTSGVKFFTMYAHLETVSVIVPQAKNGQRGGEDPMLIRAGEQIGTEDATGSTWGYGPNGTGVHLHFEYQGPGELTLPPGCP